MVFHPGFYLEKRKDAVYAVIKKELVQISKILKDEGNPIVIRPEVTGKRKAFGNLKEVLRLSSELENVLPCVDFAHLHARTGKYNSYEEFCKVLKLIENELGNEALKKMHIHVAGIQYNPKGERRHVNLRESDLNYQELLKALHDFDVKGMIICESPSLEKNALLLQTEFRTISLRQRTKHFKSMQ